MRRWGCVAIMALWLLAAACIVLLCMCLGGCSPRTVYVPTENVRTEYRDRDVEHLVTDTVHDTRFVWVKGDTVVDIRDRWHMQREYVHDTCFVERTDTVRIPYPVERELSRWQQTKMDFGGMALGALAVVIVAAAVWLVKKFRK